MNYLLAIILGAVQGLTEFLPISSTAHLIIFQKLFNLSPDQFGLAFDASLHLGTLVAVAMFFSKDYLKIITNKENILLKLIVGTVPAVIAGLFLENYIENQFRSLTVIGFALVIFSIVIFLADKNANRLKESKKIGFFGSLVIGIAQSLALVPGISRSGATMSAGLFLNQTREDAAKFAFLLSGPIIAGAGLKKFAEVASAPQNQNFTVAILGIISSFIFGYLTIKYFLKFLSNNNLIPFIIYRLILGTILIILPLFL